MSTIKANTWQNSDGSENYKCRAWVNFNGLGVVAINGSGNVSSITDLATGTYTVNFTTSFSDTNYAPFVSLHKYTSYAEDAYFSPPVSVSSNVVVVYTTAGVAADVDVVTASYFR